MAAAHQPAPRPDTLHYDALVAASAAARDLDGGLEIMAIKLCGDVEDRRREWSYWKTAAFVSIGVRMFILIGGAYFLSRLAQMPGSRPRSSLLSLGFIAAVVLGFTFVRAPRLFARLSMLRRLARGGCQKCGYDVRSTPRDLPPFVLEIVDPGPILCNECAYRWPLVPPLDPWRRTG